MWKRYEDELSELERRQNLRTLTPLEHQGDWVIRDGQRMLNLSGNDYLGLGTDLSLRQRFMESLTPEKLLMTSSSSRLLTGNYPEYEAMEELLCRLYHKEGALVVDSGYHANAGILPALCDSQTLIVADKLAHASLIDGIRLSHAGKFVRYRHNDMEHLEHILQTQAGNYKQVFVVTESVFSMDGDVAPLQTLVEMKHRYGNVLLYLDEAHGVGVKGLHGLGWAEKQECLDDMDIIVGTLGKALASAGAYILTSATLRNYLINKMRTLIFTTALPPINIAWSHFILQQLDTFQDRRTHLEGISRMLRQGLKEKGYSSSSESQIVPFLCGESHKAVSLAKELQRKGFYALPVRPPTIPEGTSRIRFSLTANISEEQIKELLHHIPDSEQ